jgi:IS605 OrfB family transposase
MPDKRHVKVMRLRILKPADGRSWPDLARLLRDARYRVFRLGNLAITEAYLAFHLFRTGRAEEIPATKMGELNRHLRDMLMAEEKSNNNKKDHTPTDHDQFSKTGALPDTVVGALSQYKIRALTSKSKWGEVLRGVASLPTFRRTGPIFVRCDKPDQRRLERTDSGDVEVELMICRKPYPRVVLATKERGVGVGQLAILNRLLDNTEQSPDGYRQRCFEVKHDERANKWWLFITYDFPASEPVGLSPERVVGVDVGYSCPLYVALNNGFARLGRRQYTALAARIRSLQRQVMARRRSVQRGGRVNLSAETARSGHGRKRKLRATEQLAGRIDSAYRTLNHQLAASVVDFAKNHGAGVIQMEDLKGLGSTLSGTFIGKNWRYHELQQFIDYKAKEAGMDVRTVNPRFTSRRCSKCGHINAGFSREARDAAGRKGFSAKFICASDSCGFEADADYNAAKNIATLDIEDIIQRQCEVQGLSAETLSQVDDEAAAPGNGRKR